MRKKLLSLQFQIAKIRVKSESENNYMESFEHLFVSLSPRTNKFPFCSNRFHSFCQAKIGSTLPFRGRFCRTQLSFFPVQKTWPTRYLSLPTPLLPQHPTPSSSSRSPRMPSPPSSITRPPTPSPSTSISAKRSSIPRVRLNMSRWNSRQTTSASTSTPRCLPPARC